METKEILGLLQNPVVLIITAIILLVLGILLHKLFTSKTITGTLKRIRKVGGIELDKYEDSKEVEDAEEIDINDVIISRSVFIRLVDDCIHRAVTSAFELANIEIQYKSELSEKVKEELESVVNIESIEYGELLEAKKKETSELLYDKESMNDLFRLYLSGDLTVHVGEPLMKTYRKENLSETTDEYISLLAGNLLSKAIPALKNAFSKYNIAYKEEAKEIFEKHIVDITNVVKNSLETAKKDATKAQVELTKETTDFNSEINKTIESLAHVEVEEVWNEKHFSD